MKRFIKVVEDDTWIDTQAEHDEWGRYYFIEAKENEDSLVYYYSDETGTNELVGTLEAESDKMIVKFKVYTQYENVFGEIEEITWEETDQDEYTSVEEAMKHADQDEYGWYGTYVKVYINNVFYRDYEMLED